VVGVAAAPNPHGERFAGVLVDDVDQHLSLRPSVVSSNWKSRARACPPRPVGAGGRAAGWKTVRARHPAGPAPRDPEALDEHHDDTGIPGSEPSLGHQHPEPGSPSPPRRSQSTPVRAWLRPARTERRAASLHAGRTEPAIGALGGVPERPVNGTVPASSM
jgi:hypothetical protein